MNESSESTGESARRRTRLTRLQADPHGSADPPAIPGCAPDSPRCGARTRETGLPCKRRARRDTGRCRMHGGVSTGQTTLRGRAASAVAGGHRSIREDPVAWAERQETRLAVLAPPPLDPLTVVAGQTLLASEIQAAAMAALPAGIDPEQALAVAMALMPHVLRAAEIQARLEDRRDRRQQATTTQAIPTAISEAPPLSEADRLRRWARELQSEAEHLELWPDGSCSEVCRRLVEMADGAQEAEADSGGDSP